MRRIHVAGTCLAAALLLYAVPAQSDVMPGGSGGTSYNSTTGRPTSTTPHESPDVVTPPTPTDNETSLQRHSATKPHHHNTNTNTGSEGNPDVPRDGDQDGQIPPPGPGPAPPHP